MFYVPDFPHQWRKAPVYERKVRGGEGGGDKKKDDIFISSDVYETGEALCPSPSALSLFLY